MRITGQDPSNNTRQAENTLRSTEVRRTRSSNEADSSNEVSTSDRVELSSQARTIQRVREVAQEAPEIRENRVVQSQQALYRGSLQLQGADLAERVLQDNLSR